LCVASLNHCNAFLNQALLNAGLQATQTIAFFGCFTVRLNHFRAVLHAARLALLDITNVICPAQTPTTKKSSNEPSPLNILFNLSTKLLNHIT
jgi:hypothetical protein